MLVDEPQKWPSVINECLDNLHVKQLTVGLCVLEKQAGFSASDQSETRQVFCQSATKSRKNLVSAICSVSAPSVRTLLRLQTPCVLEPHNLLSVAVLLLNFENENIILKRLTYRLRQTD